MEYQRTKDIKHVQRLLGYKNILDSYLRFFYYET